MVVLSESRQRIGHGTTELNKEQRVAVAKVLQDVKQAEKKKKRKRTIPNWQRHELSDKSLALLFIGILAVVLIIRRYRSLNSAAVDEPLLSNVSKVFRKRYIRDRERIFPHKNIYDEVYELATTIRTQGHEQQPDTRIFPEYERRPYTLQSIYGPDVTTCPLTVVVPNRNLGKPHSQGHPIWFSLESIGAFASNACVVLQTTSCFMTEHFEGEGLTQRDVQGEISHAIYDSALPLFRRMIEMGQVRLTFLDDEEYPKWSLQDGDDDEGLSRLFLNRWYWETEFLDMDNDFVLILQNGSSLCYHIDNLNQLQQYAIVGSVWSRNVNEHTSDLSQEGPCHGMLNQLYFRWHYRYEENTAQLPRETIAVMYPIICENGSSPLDLQGISLRSRKWMIKAIESCPHVKWSGIDNKVLRDSSCQVSAGRREPPISEALYFETILTGLDVTPRPIAYEASMFASHMLLWPEQALEQYGVPTSGDLRISAIQTGRPIISLMSNTNIKNKVTIPNAIYKPWQYHSAMLWRSKAMRNACPFLEYTFTPAVSQFQEATNT